MIINQTGKGKHKKRKSKEGREKSESKREKKRAERETGRGKREGENEEAGEMKGISSPWMPARVGLQ